MEQAMILSKGKRNSKQRGVNSSNEKSAWHGTMNLPASHCAFT
jgi:hypothetical protein